MFFTFPRKKLYLIVFSRGISAKQLARRGRCKLQEPIEGRNFGAKLTYLCGFWLDVSFFSQLKKDLSRLWLDVSIFFFFTCKKHLSLLRLARTHLRMKIFHIFSASISQYLYTLYRGDLKLSIIINNYSSSPNGLWVNSPWGREE